VAQGFSDRHDYLVRARQPATLGQVIAFIKADPSYTLVQQIGPADAPHTLVVAMTEEQVAALRRRFAGELIVERDRPLTAFQSG
jgi:hypothetical protein